MASPYTAASTSASQGTQLPDHAGPSQEASAATPASTDANVPKTGRPSHWVKAHFEVVGNSANKSKRSRCKCIYCDTTLDGKADECVKHILIACTKVSAEIRREVELTHSQGKGLAPLEPEDKKRQHLGALSQHVAG